MLHQFTPEAILQLKPFNIDLDEAARKGLAENGAVNEDYLRLEAFYGEAFWNMLQKEVNLKAFDEGLGKDAMNFIPKVERYWSVYQRYHSYDTVYIYVRNNFCVERLEDAELIALSRLATAGDAASEEAITFVRDTFRRVIKLDPEGEDDASYFYDMGTGAAGPNLALILGIDTSLELGADGKMLSPAHETEKDEFLKKLAPQLAEEISEVIGWPVVVLVE